MRKVDREDLRFLSGIIQNSERFNVITLWKENPKSLKLVGVLFLPAGLNLILLGHIVGMEYASPQRILDEMEEQYGEILYSDLREGE